MPAAPEIASTALSWPSSPAAGATLKRPATPMRPPPFQPPAMALSSPFRSASRSRPFWRSKGNDEAVHPGHPADGAGHPGGHSGKGGGRRTPGASPAGGRFTGHRDYPAHGGSPRRGPSAAYGSPGSGGRSGDSAG